MPTDGTVPRVARPRGEIPEPERTELENAREALAKAQERWESAVVRAIMAGGSYSEVAKAAGIAKSTVQKIVGSK